MMTKISYSGYRFPPEIIQQAIWLYVRFTLSWHCHTEQVEAVFDRGEARLRHWNRLAGLSPGTQ
jgi:transposase-like protein